jgi:hypothetical protein
MLVANSYVFMVHHPPCPPRIDLARILLLTLVLALWPGPGALRAKDAAGGGAAAAEGPSAAREVAVLAALPVPPDLPPRPAPSSPGEACLAAAAAAERAEGLPPGLLRAIATVESGRRADPAAPGRAAPWPWTINANGAGRFFETREEAIAAVRAVREAGIRSIDVGCGQVNLNHHPNAFASLEEAFGPEANLAYAARFLRGLHASLGGWGRAAAAYHSQTPEFAAAYALRVMAAWPDARRHGPWPAPAATGAPPPPGDAAAAPPQPPPISYGLYTPEFAARLRRIEQDRLGREAAPLRPAVRAVAAVRPGRDAPVAPPGPVWLNRPPEPVPLRPPPSPAATPPSRGKRATEAARPAGARAFPGEACAPRRGGCDGADGRSGSTRARRG